MNNVDLGPAARQLADLVARVEDVGGLALAFTAAANKDRNRYVEGAPSGNASRLDEDWRTRIPRDLGALVLAWRQPGAWDGMTRIAAMDAPAAMVGLTVADELVVHGWDVARATGQPYACEPELLDAAQSFLVQFASPDAPAGPEVAFGPSRPVPGDAPPLDRVVALAGRDPGWSPG